MGREREPSNAMLFGYHDRSIPASLEAEAAESRKIHKNPQPKFEMPLLSATLEPVSVKLEQFIINSQVKFRINKRNPRFHALRVGYRPIL